MKELVIFSSPLVSILIVITIVLHIAGVLVRKFLNGNDALVKKATVAVAIVNMAVHVAIFVVCIVISASPQEMLFITMLSTAVAMAATNFGREE